MKSVALILMAWMSTMAFAATPKTVMVPTDDLYIPKGFDSNDSAEVIVTGHFPNLCYKSPKATVTMDEKGKVKVKVEALYYGEDQMCAEVIVPFVETVELGVLDKGRYQVEVNLGTAYEQKADLFIEESTSNSVDDYIYANVEYVEKTLDSRTVKLKGHNPSDCFVLEEIQLISNGADTYSVLPKMKQISDFCPMKMTPFTYDLDIPKTDDMKSDLILLHVRVMDGKSVNSVFPNYIQ